jgi:hypothetical protein
MASSPRRYNGRHLEDVTGRHGQATAARALARIPDTHLQIHSPVARSFRANPGPPVISITLSAWPTLPEGVCLTSQSAWPTRLEGGCLTSPGDIPRLSPEFAVKLVERLGLPGVQGGKSLLNSAKGLSRWTSSRNPRSTRGQANRFPFSSSRPRRQLAYTRTRAAQQA